MSDRFEIKLENEQATLHLGNRLATSVQSGLRIALQGPLGAGKTTLCRGILRGLGYGGRVKSPTYTLVELYEVSKLHLYHFDFYRFSDPNELIESGLQDAFNETNVCIVEWPEKAGALLPAMDLEVTLSLAGGERMASLSARTENAKRCLRRLQNQSD